MAATGMLWASTGAAISAVPKPAIPKMTYAMATAGSAIAKVSNEGRASHMFRSSILEDEPAQALPLPASV